MTFPYVYSEHSLIVLTVALLLDFIVGDPERFPHPVRWIGWFIERGEEFVRRFPLDDRLQGAILAIATVAVTGTVSEVILRGLLTISDVVFLIGSCVIVYYGLSVKCLADEAKMVQKKLLDAGVGQARIQLSRIVGRDTSQLDEPRIVMATIETVAENLVDGFASPFLFASFGGPVWCMAYKAINTLDSMIGYKNERYIRFGTWAARMDDVANFVPARLSLMAIGLCAPFFRKFSVLHILKRAIQESKKHASPNSGLSEAAFALILGIRLGGPSTYEGRLVDRQYINRTGRLPEPHDISRAIGLLYASSLIIFLLVFISIIVIRLKLL